MERTASTLMQPSPTLSTAMHARGYQRRATGTVVRCFDGMRFLYLAVINHLSISYRIYLAFSA